jgi:hypothetical protein
VVAVLAVGAVGAARATSMASALRSAVAASIGSRMIFTRTQMKFCRE